MRRAPEAIETTVKQKTGKGIMRRKTRNPLSIAVFAAAALLALVAAAPASADVVWKADVRPGPSFMVPGEKAGLAILPGDAGDTPSSAFPTITVELPTGLSFVEAREPFFWSCSGTTTVTCNGPGFSFPFASGYANPVFTLVLILDVAPGAPEGTFDVPVTMEGGGASAPTTQVAQVRIADKETEFGFEPGVTAGAFDDEGNEFTQAGGHPYAASLSGALTTKFNPLGGVTGAEHAISNVDLPKDLFVDVPPGFVGNPTVLPKCESLQRVQEHICPPASQVGVATYSQISQAGKRMGGLFALQPDGDVPAMFGFDTPVGPAIMKPVLQSDGEWGLSLRVRNITEGGELYATSATLWGTPADPSHDIQRCALPNELRRTCNGLDSLGLPIQLGLGQPPSSAEPHSSNAPLVPFLTNPTRCTGVGDNTSIHIDAWHNIGAQKPNGDPDLSDPNWKTTTATSAPLTGCEKLQFNPTLSLQPTSDEAASPTGLHVELEIPQSNEDPEGIATAHLKDTVVTLPAGMTVNPAAADGLGACGTSQIGLTSMDPVRFDRSEPTCPLSSKIGSVQVDTPLLEKPLKGELYLAKQFDNPFDSLLALYIVAHGPGITAKLGGKIEADPGTGRLTTTFTDNPQVPFETFSLDFKSGPRAALITPGCGTHTTKARLTSWAAPATGVDVQDSFTITQGPNGGPCPSGTLAPRLDAGLANPIAGSSSPFTVNLSRADGSDVFTGVAVSPPEGLSANLRGIPYCSEGSIAVAISRSEAGDGAAELSSPSCPAASAIGTTIAGAGAGSSPFYVNTGRLYLAGPYKGAPLSFLNVIPAVAGPFDLGAVATRVAVHIDPRTARVRATTDPIPTILNGIPLDVRDIRVALNRPGFAQAPTDCSPMSVDATVSGTGGASANVSSPFQLGACAALGFKPSLALRLKGGTRRGAHPALRAELKARPGDANIAAAAVSLPHSAFLDQAHIRTVCTRVQFAANNCPAGSVYGYARAFTPLLDQPLQGPVYLRSSSNKLPDMVAVLNGQVQIELAGRIDSANGGLRNTFDLVPDAAVSKFILTLQGGKRGLIVNSRNLCATTNRANVKLGAQNGRRYDFRPEVVAQGCQKGRGHKRHPAA